MKLYSLICEGRCNPMRPTLDSAVRSDVKLSQAPVGTESLWRLQRKLVYTPHEMTDHNHARCVECGAVRRFGA